MIKVYDISRKYIMLFMHNNRYLCLTGLLTLLQWTIQPARVKFSKYFTPKNFTKFYITTHTHHGYWAEIFRSTALSWPNKAGLGVCPYVRPQSFSNSNEVWCVGRGRQVMHDDMPSGLTQGEGHVALKVRNFSIFKESTGLIFQDAKPPVTLTRPQCTRPRSWVARPKIWALRPGQYFKTKMNVVLLPNFTSVHFWFISEPL